MKIIRELLDEAVGHARLTVHRMANVTIPCDECENTGKRLTPEGAELVGFAAHWLKPHFASEDHWHDADHEHWGERHEPRHQTSRAWTRVWGTDPYRWRIYRDNNHLLEAATLEPTWSHVADVPAVAGRAEHWILTNERGADPRRNGPSTTATTPRGWR